MPSVRNVAPTARQSDPFVSIDEIDFFLSTLDHFNKQFSMYHFVDSDLPPLLPEDDNNCLANIQNDLLDVTIDYRFSDQTLSSVAMSPASVIQSDSALLAQVKENIGPISCALYSMDCQVSTLKTSWTHQKLRSWTQSKTKSHFCEILCFSTVLFSGTRSELLC